MTERLTGLSYIAGSPAAERGAPFHSINPRTGARGSTVFYNATPAVIDSAAEAAAAAFAETRTYPAARLADFLDAVAAEIEALGDALLETADEETALGLTRLTGERARTTMQLRKFGALLREGSYVGAIIDTAQPDRQPAPRPDIRRMLFPIGPVAVFGASNFPFAFSVAGGDTASAFAAGCPVIVKAHPGHPATSELTARAINRAVSACGFPAGFFSLVQGDQIEVGQQLVMHPRIEAVGFTGSLRAGRAIFDAAAARPRPIPVYAEMGSINPVVLLPSAIAARGETLATALVDSVTLGTGQFCTNPGIVFVIDGDETRTFIEQTAAAMAARQPGTLLNPQIEQGLVKAVGATLSRPGVEKLIGGHKLEGPACGYAHTILQTTGAALRADDALQAEHFGPVTLFVICESFADLLESLRALHGNLTATVHAEPSEIEAASAVYDVLREKAGRLIWNGFPTGVEVVYAMQHGGPYPATTAPATTSVGMMAILRFLRPVAFQNMPEALLPDALKDANPLGIWRIVDEQWTQGPVG